MKIVNKICMGLFLVSLPAMYYGTALAWCEMLGEAVWLQSRTLAFFVGVLMFLPARLLAETVFVRQWNILMTLEHEITHVLFAVLFLKFPTGLRVTALEGGHAKYVGFGSTGQTWITLGPYFFPTFPFILLLATLIIGIEGLPVLLLLGFGTAFHIYSTWKETHADQSDIRKATIWRAILILPLLNLLSVGVIASYVLGGFPLGSIFLTTIGGYVCRFSLKLLSIDIRGALW